MSTEPSPKANPMDVLFRASGTGSATCCSSPCIITVFWFVLGPIKVQQPSVVRGGCGLGNIRPRARSARPCSCDVCLANGSASLRASASSTACSASEFSAGCSMSPDGIALCQTHAGILRQKGRLTLPGTVGASRCCRPRNLLCHPRTIGRPRTFQQAPVERRTMDAVAGCSRSSLPGAATALHHASTPASVG